MKIANYFFAVLLVAFLTSCSTNKDSITHNSVAEDVLYEQAKKQVKEEEFKQAAKTFTRLKMNTLPLKITLST